MWQVLTIFLCFNRYIVECKFVWGRYRNTGRDGFNRYIVECKYRIEAGDFGNGREF